ncbi:aspartate-semialdehyde dehydrogenase, partial [Candidatus Bathyarchaeota archaeon]
MAGKIKVGVLGATGIVGQKFVKLLERNPWFRLEVVAASEKSVGKVYGEAIRGSGENFSDEIKELEVKPLNPKAFRDEDVDI